MSLGIYKDASFFKVLFHLSSKLRIPDAFVNKYCELLPEEAFLITNDESEKCEKYWKVRIKQFDDCYWFVNGLPEFVKDNSLISILNFAVFMLVMESTVQVTVYGKNGVNKMLSSLLSGPSSQRKDLWRPSSQGEDSYSDVADIQSFTTVITEHHKYYFSFPIGFYKGMGMVSRRAIKLHNNHGTEWVVKVVKRKSDGRFGLMMEDWRVFIEENNLTIGTRLIFTCNSSDCGTLLVTIKRGRTKDEETYDEDGEE